MTFYSGMQGVATELLTEFGQTITWSRTTGGTFDPAEGTTTGGTTTNYSGYGALFDFNSNLVDGDNIKATDKRLLLQSGDVPELNDVLTVNGTAYTVLNIEELNPAGTTVKYELQLRS
jgi:hypothetical protein